VARLRLHFATLFANEDKYRFLHQVSDIPHIWAI